MSTVRIELTQSMNKVGALGRALSRADQQPADLIKQLYDARIQLETIDKQINGYDSKSEVGERNAPSPRDGQRLGFSALGTTYGPTGNHKKAFERSTKQLSDVKVELAKLVDTVIPGLEEAVANTGAPMIEGQGKKN